MKAAVYERYGPPEVVEVKDIPKPSPKDDEVLIEIRATTVSAADWRLRSLELPPGFGIFARLMFGLRRPRQPVLGSELAGRVVEVGKRVTKLAVGDDVVAFPGASLGCHAEYRCLHQDAPIVRMPANLGYDEAAALAFGGTTALAFLRKGNVQAGERVLVHGASGSVGTAAVQLAKHLGAHVTGVCSTANLELVRSLGADHVIDYTKEDFTKNGESYAVIMDTVGTAGWARSNGSLERRGRLLSVVGGLGELLRIPWVALTSRKRILGGAAPERIEDLQQLVALAEAGEFQAVIDRRYPLEEIVEAHRHVDRGHKRGNVVVTIERRGQAHS